MQERRVTLRPVEPADLEMIDKWLHKPYIRKWYGDPAAWIAEIENKDGAYDWLHHFIVKREPESGREGKPIGFCQYMDVARAPEGFEWDGEPPGTFAIAYLIGEEACLKQGFGSAILRALIGLIASVEAPVQYIADPVPENEDSIRLLRRNGFALDAATGLYKRPA